MNQNDDDARQAELQERINGDIYETIARAIESEPDMVAVILMQALQAALCAITEAACDNGDTEPVRRHAAFLLALMAARLLSGPALMTAAEARTLADDDLRALIRSDRFPRPDHDDKTDTAETRH